MYSENQLMQKRESEEKKIWVKIVVNEKNFSNERLQDLQGW
jgi:hypothetical protein